MKETRLCLDAEVLGKKALEHIQPNTTTELHSKACSPICPYMTLQEYCFLFKADVSGYERAEECINNVIVIRSEDNEK